MMADAAIVHLLFNFCSVDAYLNFCTILGGSHLKFWHSIYLSSHKFKKNEH